MIIWILILQIKLNTVVITTSLLSIRIVELKLLSLSIHYDMLLQSLRTWTVTGRPTIFWIFYSKFVFSLSTSFLWVVTLLEFQFFTPYFTLPLSSPILLTPLASRHPPPPVLALPLLTVTIRTAVYGVNTETDCK